jgi:hypothetical protein
MKTSETKKFVKIFCETFLIFKKPSRTYFHFYKKGFLNSQAVRIRVKLKSKGINCSDVPHSTVTEQLPFREIEVWKARMRHIPRELRGEPLRKFVQER